MDDEQELDSEKMAAFFKEPAGPGQGLVGVTEIDDMTVVFLKMWHNDSEGHFELHLSDRDAFAIGKELIRAGAEATRQNLSRGKKPYAQSS